MIRVIDTSKASNEDVARLESEVILSGYRMNRKSDFVFIRNISAMRLKNIAYRIGLILFSTGNSYMLISEK